MDLATTFPKPQPLALDRPFKLRRDAVEITNDEDLPAEFAEGLGLPLKTTHGYDNGGDELDFDVRWSVGKGEYENAYRVKADGILDALAGARELAQQTEAVAVVQSKDGSRYVAPLAVWTEYDESELSFEWAGGTPYWNGAKDHVLIGPSHNGVDVEAIVFDDGRSWINLTGHPIRTK